jgi:phage shock protein A
MFEDLQRLFRKSVDAFRAELSKREPEDQVADLLSGMRREMVAARAAIPLLEEDVCRLRADLESERVLLEQCERRLSMAERIGDDETVRVAREFAERHRERKAVLEKKEQAATAELALRSRESEDMLRKYQESDRNRFGLVSQLRRQQAAEKMRERLQNETGPFADFARMEDAVRDSEAHAAAAEELDFEQESASHPPPRSDLEERLQELKRRMGK